MLRHSSIPCTVAFALGTTLLFATPAGAQQTRQVTVTITEGTNMAAALSPDGRTLAIDLQGTIWTLPVTGGEPTPITDKFGDARQPAWSPDGLRVAFQSFRDENWHVWSVSADSSELTQHTFGPYDDREPHWSRDGAQIVFSSDRSGNYDIWKVHAESGVLEQITTHEAHDYYPVYSPAGTAIAFVSERDSLPGVWLRDETGNTRPIAYGRGSLAGVSWSPDGTLISFNAIANSASSLLLFDVGSTVAETRTVSAVGEDVFPFRTAWTSDEDFLYTADGKIKRGTTSGGAAGEISFTAELDLTRHIYERKQRDFDSTDPVLVKGIVSPVVSPAGNEIAFTALGDLWIMPIGGEPRRLTDDRYVDLYPMWSPDGSRLAFSTDRSGRLEVWIRDMSTGNEHRLTRNDAGGALLPVWSPDGSTIVFTQTSGFSFSLNSIDVATGEVTFLRDDLFGPGRPTYSADGRTLAMSALRQYSTRFREGRNEILLMSLDGGADRQVTPVPHRSVGTRGLDGPVWSPDGSKMVFVADGILHVVSVGPNGDLLGPPRPLATGFADGLSWTGDSKSVVFQTAGGLRRVSLVDGVLDTILVDLTWARKQPTTRLVIHAGHLFDGKTESLRRDVDIVVEGHRIVEIVPHRDDLHADSVVDASDLTVMPGLIESHTHLGWGMGEALDRIWLSYGITLVRDPGLNPDYLVLERREAIDAGVRIGPRHIGTGLMFDGTRIYYPGGTPLSAGSNLGLILERADQLDVDMIKTYVRMPDLLQKRIVAYAHEIGVPVASHELYPAASYGIDHLEHVGATSRRGYSPKVTRTNHSYQDIIALISESGITLTPTIGMSGGFWLAAARDSTLINDPRMTTLFDAEYVEYLNDRAAGVARDSTAVEASMRPLGSTVRRVVSAGGTVMAGTDSPFVPYGLSLHTELENYVDGGLSPFEALQTATVAPAAALGLGDQLGSIEPGKLADMVMVRGNPLADIKNARRVCIVVKNGEVFTLDDLLQRPMM